MFYSEMSPLRALLGKSASLFRIVPRIGLEPPSTNALITSKVSYTNALFGIEILLNKFFFFKSSIVVFPT